MTSKKPKGMDTVFIFEVVWLVACPVMEVKRSSITPHKRSFRVDISEAQPRMLPSMEVLNIDIFFLIVDTGKMSTQNWTFSLTTAPRITGRHFSVTVSFKVGPVVGTYVCKIIIEFITSILKLPWILSVWLATSSVRYSRINHTMFYTLKLICTKYIIFAQKRSSDLYHFAFGSKSHYF